MGVVRIMSVCGVVMCEFGKIFIKSALGNGIFGGSMFFQ